MLHHSPKSPRGDQPLTLGVLGAYALPALPFAVLTLPLYVVVPTHYAKLGVPAATVGLVLLLVRAFDALIDPIGGFLADRTRSRYGRRRIWFAAGIPPTALGAYALFSPPAMLSAGGGALYLLFWGMVLSVGWTIALVPFTAWGAELSTTYEGRNRVSAWRETVTFLGTLVALSAQAIFGDTATTLAFFALFIAIGLPVAATVTLAVVPEPVDRSTARLSLSAGLRHMRANKPFLRLIVAFFINSLANGFPATLFLLFVTDRLAMPEAAAGRFLVTYVAAGIMAVPFWLWLAKRWSKHMAWCAAMLVACAAFSLAPFLGAGDGSYFLIICVFTGLAVGADIVLPASLQADVIDVDTAASGEQRSGLYLACWGLATKMALAFAVGIAFPALVLFGFDATSGGEKSQAGLVALGVLYAGIPVVLKLGAIALMWRFPLTAEQQRALRDTISARAAA